MILCANQKKHQTYVQVVPGRRSFPNRQPQRLPLAMCASFDSWLVLSIVMRLCANFCFPPSFSKFLHSVHWIPNKRSEHNSDNGWISVTSPQHTHTHTHHCTPQFICVRTRERSYGSYAYPRKWRCLRRAGPRNIDFKSYAQFVR